MYIIKLAKIFLLCCILLTASCIPNNSYVAANESIRKDFIISHPEYQNAAIESIRFTDSKDLSIDTVIISSAESGTGEEDNGFYKLDTNGNQIIDENDGTRREILSPIVYTQVVAADGGKSWARLIGVWITQNEHVVMEWYLATKVSEDENGTMLIAPEDGQKVFSYNSLDANVLKSWPLVDDSQSLMLETLEGTTAWDRRSAIVMDLTKLSPFTPDVFASAYLPDITTATSQLWSETAITTQNVDKIRQLYVWGSGAPLKTLHNQDQSIFLIQTDVGTYIYNLSSTNPLVSKLGTINATLSDDGSAFSIAYSNGLIQVFQLEDSDIPDVEFYIKPKKYEYYDVYNGTIISIGAMSFSKDNRWIAIGTADGRVGIWNTKTASELALFAAENGYTNAPVTQVSFSPNGKYLFTQTLVNSVYEIKGNLVKYVGRAGGLFSPDSTLVAGFGCGHLYIYESKNAKLKVDLPITRDPEGIRCRRLYELSFSDDSTQVVIDFPELNERQIRNASNGDLIKKEDLWPAETIPSSKWLLEHGHFQNLVGATVLPDKTLLAWGATGEEIYWWKDAGNLLVAQRQETERVFFSDDGQKALWCKNGEITLLQLSGTKASIPVPDFPLCDGIVLSPDNDSLVIWSGKRIALVSIDSGAIQNLERQPSNIAMAVFSNDGSFIASATGEVRKQARYAEGEVSTISLWQVKPVKELVELNNRTVVLDLEFSEDSQILAIQGILNRETNQAELWNLTNGDVLKKIKLDGSDIKITLANDNQLVSAGDDGRIRFWNMENGNFLKNMRGHFSLYGNNDYFGWDTSKGYIYSLLNIRELVFLPDDTGLLSIGSDGTIRLWGIKP